jgi:hypothetical protein
MSHLWLLSAWADDYNEICARVTATRATFQLAGIRTSEYEQPIDGIQCQGGEHKPYIGVLRGIPLQSHENIQLDVGNPVVPPQRGEVDFSGTQLSEARRTAGGEGGKARPQRQPARR